MKKLILIITFFVLCGCKNEEILFDGIMPLDLPLDLPYEHNYFEQETYT